MLRVPARAYANACCEVVQGQLCALDVGEASVLHEDLLMDGLQVCLSLLHDCSSHIFLCCINVCMIGSSFIVQCADHASTVRKSSSGSYLAIVRTQDVRTVLETDFGQAVCDVNYFDSLPGERVYVCGGASGDSSRSSVPHSRL